MNELTKIIAHKDHIIAQVEEKLQNPLDVTEMFKLKADLYLHTISLVLEVEKWVFGDVNRTRE
jgi:hypothetical protein